MNTYDIQEDLFHEVPLKILSFLSLNYYEMLSAKEIQDAAKTSKGSTFSTIKTLLNLGIIMRQKKGNLFLYTVDRDNPILKAYRIFENLILIRELAEKLKPHSSQIILYGSFATGTNVKESDIDLFIKTQNKKNVEKIIRNYDKLDFKIQAAIYDPLELASSAKEDAVYFDQVKKGIVLWEGKESYEEV